MFKTPKFIENARARRSYKKTLKSLYTNIGLSDVDRAYARVKAAEPFPGLDPEPGFTPSQMIAINIAYRKAVEEVIESGGCLTVKGVFASPDRVSLELLWGKLRQVAGHGAANNIINKLDPATL